MNEIYLRQRESHAACSAAKLPPCYQQRREDLALWLREKKFSSSHLKSLMARVYRQHKEKKTTPTLMPTQLIKAFDECFNHSLPSITHSLVSSQDSTVRQVVTLHDGAEVEMVILPEGSRITLCVSTQVGCRQGCGFCATGRMGLWRQLQGYEIIAQILLAQSWIQKNHNILQRGRTSLRHGHALAERGESFISNVVFMGMGEPCDNTDALKQALSIMLDPWALSLSPRKITLSTAGHLQGLRTLYHSFPQISYALSLHHTNSRNRRVLMPIERRFPLEEVLAFFREKSQRHGKVFMIQYTLMRGINDGLEQAQELAHMLRGIHVKINLLRLNPTVGSRYQRSEAQRTQRFARCLKDLGFTVTERPSKGEDIQGACGQLIRHKESTEIKSQEKIIS